MYIFKHSKDLSQVPPGSPERIIVESILDRFIQVHATPPGYDPEAHGYVVLMEAQDLARQTILPELPCPLTQVSWEGVTLVGGFFHGVVLTNNQFGIDFVIPDADWLSETLRVSLMDNLPQT